jgi:histidinol dehydrogenase
LTDDIGEIRPMATEYVKRSRGLTAVDISDTTKTVIEMLGRLEAEGEKATRAYSRELDDWAPDSRSPLRRTLSR